MYTYRPSKETNKKVFFDQLNETLDKAVNKYYNIFIAGDLNIDTGDKSKDTNNYLCDFMDTFSLNYLIKVKTCYKSATGTILDIMLTKKMRSFQKTSVVTTGISDCHKMIVTCLKTNFKKLLPKKIVYIDYKNTFLYDLDQNLIYGKFYFQKNSYDLFTETFKNVVDHHAPLKKKFVCGYDVPFMTKHLRKAIMNRSRCKHKYLKFPSRENFLAMKNMRNKCNSLFKKAKTQYFKKCTSKNFSNNKQFWNLVKTFLTNKSSFSTDSITIKDKDIFIDDEKELVEIFNNYYVNIVGKTLGKPVENSFENCDDNFEAVLKIIKK